jgi:hypothetical protein
MIIPPVLLAWLLMAGQASPLAVSGASWSHAVSGSFRNLFSASRSLYTQARYADDLSRLRLRVAGARGYGFSYEIVADSETHVGNRVTLPDFAGVRHRQDATWLDLQHVVVDRTYGYSDLSLYRGSASFRTASTTVTIGRQRIAWGTARFWSPADVFNPIDPLQVEGDVRQGVDAVQVEWAPPDRGWRAAAVYAPQERWERSTAAFRVGRTVAGWDITAFGGRFRQDWVGGADAAGQWGGAGVRAEMTYTRRGDVSPGDNALRLTAGTDYARSRLYVVGEYFYNQARPPCGSIATCAATSLLPTAELFTLHRHFVSAGASYSLTPLLKAETYLVADLAGSSLLVNPLLRYNAATNIDLSIGAQLFATGTGGEFRGVPSLLFAQLDIHF